MTSDSFDQQVQMNIELGVRALIVEDEVAMRTLLAQAMQTFGFEVSTVGEATSALDRVEAFDPDIVLLDLDLGDGPNGLSLIRPILEVAPYCSILVLTAFRSPGLVDTRTFLQPGVGYLTKRDIVDVRVLFEAVRSTMAQQRIPRPRQVVAPVISKDQAEVLRLIAQGLSNEAIRAQRHCSRRALERIIGRLFARLGLGGVDDVNARAAAVNMYRTQDIVVK